MQDAAGPKKANIKSSGPESNELDHIWKALRGNDTKYRTLFEKAGDAIFFLEAAGENTGRIVDANHCAARMHGYTRKELIGKNIKELDGPEDAKKAGERIRRMAKGEWIRTEAIHRKKDGSLFFVEISAGIIHLDGTPFILAFDRDISKKIKTEIEKQELRKKLYQAQKMEAIGNLSAGIAHDFNNILSGILGSSQLLSLYASESPKLKNEIDKIINGTHRAADLVRQILSFSRQTETEKLPVRVSAIVQEALKLIRASMPSFIEIDTRISSRTRILADPGRIHQLLMNLCTNACHAMAEEGGTLRVIVRDTDISDHKSDPEFNLAPDKFLTLEISDTGCGISQEHIDRIFEPYFSLNPHKGGTGLGLSIVHAVVEEHQGHINVTSHQDKGSVFKIYFPIVEQDDELPPEKDPETSGESPGTELIMIVDDEDYILSSTSGYLEDWGYRTRCFSNGSEALAAFKADPDQIDLLITDMTMPGLKGNELARQLQTVNPELPVILCSGHRQESAENNLKITGNLNFFQKPVDLQTLTQTIRKMLDKKKG